MMKQRNYGVDLLRIVSMFMIVMLHFLGHGGLLSSVEEGTANYRAAWFLETIAYSGVATFASISGYVGWNPMKQEKNRALGFIQLWMQVVFYSLIILQDYILFQLGLLQYQQFFVHTIFTQIYCIIVMSQFKQKKKRFFISSS